MSGVTTGALKRFGGNTDGDWCVCVNLWIEFLLLLSLPPVEFFDAEGSDVDLNFGGLRGRGVKKQDPPIERDLYLSLEDLFFGCTKKIKISRRVSRWLAPPGSHPLSPDLPV